MFCLFVAVYKEKDTITFERNIAILFILKGLFQMKMKTQKHREQNVKELKMLPLTKKLPVQDSLFKV